MDALIDSIRDKQIIAILDSDKSYGEYEFSDGNIIKVKMPYLSGPDLCSVSTRFGFYIIYLYEGDMMMTIDNKRDQVQGMKIRS
jgi:hypothetical protein